MKVNKTLTGKASLRAFFLAGLAFCAALGQTRLNLSTQGRTVDFSRAPSTRPEQTGTAVPSTCTPGELFFSLSAPAGQNLYSCSGSDKWAVVGTAASPPPIGGISFGLVASLPTVCVPGNLYFATDRPAGQQIYTCSSANTWTEIVSLGSSGALAYNNGSLDVVATVIPQLALNNVFSGLNAFSLGHLEGGDPSFSSIGVCGSSARGRFNFIQQGSQLAAGADGLFVCRFNGGAYSWFEIF